MDLLTKKRAKRRGKLKSNFRLLIGLSVVLFHGATLRDRSHVQGKMAKTGDCDDSADLPSAFLGDALGESARNQVQITAGSPNCDQNAAFSRQYIDIRISYTWSDLWNFIWK